MVQEALKDWQVFWQVLYFTLSGSAFTCTNSSSIRVWASQVTIDIFSLQTLIRLIKLSSGWNWDCSFLTRPHESQATPIFLTKSPSVMINIFFFSVLTSFGRNPNISEEFIERFAKVISKLENLSRFDLYFRGFSFCTPCHLRIKICRLSLPLHDILELGNRIQSVGNVQCSCSKKSIHIFKKLEDWWGFPIVDFWVFQETYPFVFFLLSLAL